MNNTHILHTPPAPTAVASSYIDYRAHGTGQRSAQRGISLFIVIVVVMLSMLLAVWSSRTSLFNEMIVGNDADYQRAFEAAQALLLDAELDIRGENADGSICKRDRNKEDVCRSTTSDQIPLEPQDVPRLLETLDAQSSKCRNALCTKRLGRQDFWNYLSTSTSPPKDIKPGEIALDKLMVNGIGARYGQYTSAAVGDSDNPANPILADTSELNKGGWYWIEVLPYDESSKNSGLIVNEGSGNLMNNTTFLSLSLFPNVVYRITALAYGRKPNTMVVLQQTYARQILKD